MPPVPLTVGVEWEFLFGYVDGRAPDPWDAFHGSLLHHLGLMQDLFRDQTAYPEERQLAVFRHVARTLQEDAEIGGAFDVVCETALAQQAARSYAAWVVKPDPSLRNPTLHLDSGRGGYYEFEQVELNSPVLPADDDEEEEEGRTTTYELLARATQVVKRDCRLKLNDTCALHVHVGMASATRTTAAAGAAGAAALTLQLKKLRTLLLLAEGRIARLYHPTRAARSENQFWAMFARFARFSELARTRDLRLPPGAGLEAFRLWVEGALREEEGAAAGGCAVEGLECADRLADRLRLLWRDDNGVVDVLRLLCSHAAPHTQRLSFNFLGLYGHYTHSRPAGRDPKPTVEFRGMEGTMDPDTVVHWTRACVQLVRFAIDSGPTAYRRVLQNLTRRPPDAYTVLDLLLDVGCDPDTTGRHFAEKMSGGHFRCCNHSAEAAGDFVPARCPTHGR